jgi:protein AroM
LHRHVEGLQSERAWLVEPDHIIPGTVAGLVEKRQRGVIVPIASRIDSERDKWGACPPPLFAVVSPYSDGPEAVFATGERLQADGAEAVLLDRIGFTERHRDTLAALDMPVILSNAVVEAVGELFGR